MTLLAAMSRIGCCAPATPTTSSAGTTANSPSRFSMAFLLISSVLLGGPIGPASLIRPAGLRTYCSLLTHDGGDGPPRRPSTETASLHLAGQLDHLARAENAHLVRRAGRQRAQRVPDLGRIGGGHGNAVDRQDD